VVAHLGRKRLSDTREVRFSLEARLMDTGCGGAHKKVTRKPTRITVKIIQLPPFASDRSRQTLQSQAVILQATSRLPMRDEHDAGNR
jgi:hypothetical protein